MTPPHRCFAHQHMPASTYAIYDVCRAMASRHKGIVYFSGPKVAGKFLSMGQNTPYKAAAYLQDRGWFKLVSKSGRRADGTRSPTLYKVIDHDQWAAEHPGCCTDPSGDWMSTLSPSQFEGIDDPSPSHSGEGHHILEINRHILENDRHTESEQTDKELLITTTDKNTDVCSQPFPLNVMDAIPPSCDGASAAAAPLLEGGPYAENVMDESTARRFGLMNRNGEWFTGEGVKVHPNALAVLLKNGEAL